MGAAGRVRQSTVPSFTAPILDHPTVLVALILGIVEGLTEFLPVSSTGHLIVAGSLLGYTGEQAKVFEIVIQAGAILAVCWEYRNRLLAVAAGLPRSRDAQRFVLNLMIAFLPAAVLGLLFSRVIKSHLFAPIPVALAFIIGALIILFVERRQRRAPSTIRIDNVDAIRWPDALKIGIAQAFALIPGTSRSGATIWSAEAGASKSPAYSRRKNARLCASAAPSRTCPTNCGLSSLNAALPSTWSTCTCVLTT